MSNQAARKRVLKAQDDLEDARIALRPYETAAQLGKKLLVLGFPVALGSGISGMFGIVSVTVAAAILGGLAMITGLILILWTNSQSHDLYIMMPGYTGAGPRIAVARKVVRKAERELNEALLDPEAI